MSTDAWLLLIAASAAVTALLWYAFQLFIVFLTRD